MKKLLLIGAILAFSISLKSYAQNTPTPGTLDPEWGEGNGIASTQIGNHTFLVDMIHDICVTKDNITVAVGASAINGKKEAALVGYNQFGYPSNYFGDRGIVLFNIPGGGNNFLNGVTSNPDDGSIIACGHNSNKAAQTFQGLIVKVNNAGVIDETFGGNGARGIILGKLSSVLEDVKVQKDGKILVCGELNNRILVSRYNADGSNDESFGEGGSVVFSGTDDIPNAFGQQLAIQEDGKILVCGFGFTETSYYLGIVHRLNSDGTLDTSFGEYGTKIIDNWGQGNEFIKSVLVQKDGKILIGGHSWDQNSNAATKEELKYSLAVMRLNHDGSVDTSFGVNGLYRKNFLPSGATYMSHMVQSPEGNIYAGISLEKRANSESGEVYNVGIVALDDMGRDNQNFGENGVVITNMMEDHGESIALQGNDKIVIGCRSYHPEEGTKFTVLRYFRDTTKGTELVSSEDETFLLYPNPVEDVLHIDFVGTYTIKIFDATGKNVYTGENIHDINVKDFAKGTYFVELITENKSHKSSFIKK